MKSTILITGTSSGLGRELVNHYIKKYIVIGISRRKIQNKKNYFHYCADISKKTIIKKILRKIFFKHKKIDFLINNAATNNSSGILAFVSDDNIDKDIRTNIFGNIYLTKIVSSYMMRAKFGRIVNIGSIASRLCFKGDSIYASCKNFLETFTKILGKELISHGITSNIICISLFDGGLDKKISLKYLKIIKKKYRITRYVNLKKICQVLDGKIFIKKPKYNSKIFKIF